MFGFSALVGSGSELSMFDTIPEYLQYLHMLLLSIRRVPDLTKKVVLILKKNVKYIPHFFISILGRIFHISGSETLV